MGEYKDGFDEQDRAIILRKYKDAFAGVFESIATKIVWEVVFVALANANHEEIDKIIDSMVETGKGMIRSTLDEDCEDLDEEDIETIQSLVGEASADIIAKFRLRYGTTILTPDFLEMIRAAIARNLLA